MYIILIKIYTLIGSFIIIRGLTYYMWKDWNNIKKVIVRKEDR